MLMHVTTCGKLDTHIVALIVTLVLIIIVIIIVVVVVVVVLVLAPVTKEPHCTAVETEEAGRLGQKLGLRLRDAVWKCL